MQKKIPYQRSRPWGYRLGQAGGREFLPWDTPRESETVCAATTLSRASMRSAIFCFVAAVFAVSPSLAGCGKERWEVKTGSDPDAAAIDLHAPVPVTIESLVEIPKPLGRLPGNIRISSTERSLYLVHGLLTTYKVETGEHGDSDYHLVIQEIDAQNCKDKLTEKLVPCTMIAEVPDPKCVDPRSPFARYILQARAAVERKCLSRSKFTPAMKAVQLTGIGFFDRVHRQKGVAGNGIELHPVLDVSFDEDEESDVDDTDRPLVPVKAAGMGSPPPPVKKFGPPTPKVAAKRSGSSILMIVLGVGVLFWLGVAYFGGSDLLRGGFAIWMTALGSVYAEGELASAFSGQQFHPIDCPPKILILTAMIAATSLLGGRTPEGADPSPSMPSPFFLRHPVYQRIRALIESTGPSRKFAIASTLGAAVLFLLNGWSWLNASPSGAGATLPDIDTTLLSFVGVADVVYLLERLLRHRGWFAALRES
jgi:hypothetical protein